MLANIAIQYLDSKVLQYFLPRPSVKVSLSVVFFSVFVCGPHLVNHLILVSRILEAFDLNAS